MTHEEAINTLKVILEEATETEDSICYVTSGDADALKAAIKALEQEPFINKPCISERVCHEDKMQVLDKIRAEIVDLEEGFLSYFNPSPSSPWVYKDEVLYIIDKYKEEREE